MAERDTLIKKIGSLLEIVLGGITTVVGDLSLKEDKANKGTPNGYAQLDAGGLLPTALFPAKIMEYEGQYNATTDNPHLANTDVGLKGSVYEVTVAGTIDFGAGAITFAVGDWVVNDGTIWYKSKNSVNAAAITLRSPMTFALTGGVTPYVSTNSNNYTVLSRIPFSGTTLLGVPSDIKANAYSQGGSPGIQIRVVDDTSGLVIAESVVITSIDESNFVTLGLLSNLPTTSTTLTIEGKRTGGGASCRISSLQIEF